MCFYSPDLWLSWWDTRINSCCMGTTSAQHLFWGRFLPLWLCLQLRRHHWLVHSELHIRYVQCLNSSTFLGLFFGHFLMANLPVVATQDKVCMGQYQISSIQLFLSKALSPECISSSSYIMWNQKHDFNHRILYRNLGVVAVSAVKMGSKQ